MESTVKNISIAHDICDRPPSVTFTVLYAAVCSTCFLFGILYCFLGYRFFKATMFLTGFMFGALVSYVVIRSEIAVPIGGKIGIILAAGVLCGLITMLVQYVGLFMTGFMLGQLVAVVVLIILEQFTHPPSRWVAIGILFGCGVLFALLSLYFQRGLTIIGSSVLGAAAIAVGVDYCAEDFAMLRYVIERIHVEVSRSPVCWYSWALLAVWPLLSLLGIGIQWRLTGAHIDHKENTTLRRPRKARVKKQQQHHQVSSSVVPAGATAKKQSTSLAAAARRPSYRQLYQIRRTNGDIISQSYLENIMYRHSPDTVHLIRETPAGRYQARSVNVM